MTYASTKFTDLLHAPLLAAVTACMAVALTGVAHAAGSDDGAPTVRVAYGDLNLASEQGDNTLNARITAAARQVCVADRVDNRDLTAYALERACETRAISNAVHDVHGTKLAASASARHGQG
jgi:UrcA family protein